MPSNNTNSTSYQDEPSYINSIMDEYSHIADIIGYNYKVYTKIKSYLNDEIKYTWLHKSELRMIPLDMMSLIIELDYDDIDYEEYDVRVTMKLFIGKHCIKHNVNCWNHLICDEVLIYCEGLRKLIANYNENITTCAPFADTLEELEAIDESGIDDYSLKQCHKLRFLDATDNPKITTCKPFADTLEELHANGSGITDNGIKHCHNIRKLCANGNPKIIKRP